jgi:hypothetical protein
MDKPGAQNRWLWGDHRPSYPWREKLFEQFGIPVGAWNMEPAAPFTPPAIAEERASTIPSPPPPP